MHAKVIRSLFALLGLSVLLSAQAGASDSTALLRFTGNRSHVHLGSANAALDVGRNGEPFTLEGWVWLETVAGEHMLYTHVREYAPGERQPQLIHRYSFGVRDSGNAMTVYNGTTWIDADVAIQAKRWHHLAYSFDSTTLRFYLDGELVDEMPFTMDTATSSLHLYLGGYSAASDPDGYLRDLRIWDHARTAADIANHRYTLLTGAETGLRAAWRMDAGQGGFVTDLSPNENDGSIRNKHYAWTDYTEGWRHFTLADPRTGSTGFTNTNAVDVTFLPVPPGYTHYQITEQDDPDALGSVWLPVDSMTAQAEFTTPATDEIITLHAWFTNTTEVVPVIQAEAEIVYTLAVPVPAVRTAIQRETAGFTVRVEAHEIDAGSNGGTAAGRKLDVARMTVVCAADDATPDAPHATLDGLGVYSLLLEVVNEAGNVATSAVPTELVVVEASKAPQDAQRYVAAGNLHAKAPYDNWTHAAASIQDAVNEAATGAPGELIRVWPGRYTAPTNAVAGSGAVNVVNLDAAVTLRAVGDALNTFIDGEGLHRGMRINVGESDPPVVIDGFTFTNGVTSIGGAVRFSNSGNVTQLLNSRFVDNVARGVYNSSSGGAIYAVSPTLMVSNCLFRANRAIAGYGHGAAITFGGGSLQVFDSRFENNTADLGTHQRGAVFYLPSWSGYYEIDRSVFIGNRSSIVGNAASGGTIHLMGGNCTLSLRNALFVDNQGYTFGSLLRLSNRNGNTVNIENCTITGSNGRAIAIQGGDGSFSVFNSIFHGNTAEDFWTFPSGFTPVTMSNSVANLRTQADVPDYEAAGNWVADPLFADPEGGDFRLKRDSPAINTGVYRDWMTGARDLDGKPRIDPIFNQVDRGAYEYVYGGTLILVR